MAEEEFVVSSGLEGSIDFILYNGVVVDTWVRVSLVGVEFLDVEPKIFFASVQIYLKYAEAIGLTAKAA